MQKICISFFFFFWLDRQTNLRILGLSDCKYQDDCIGFFSQKRKISKFLKFVYGKVAIFEESSFINVGVSTVALGKFTQTGKHFFFFFCKKV